MARQGGQFPPEKATGLKKNSEEAVKYTAGHSVNKLHTDKTKEELSETTENRECSALVVDGEERNSKLRPELSHTLEDKEDSDINEITDTELDKTTITAGPNLKSLATKQKHLQVRIAANQKYLENNKYSKRRYKKSLSFHLGDNVSVRIPRIDRAETDLPLLPCTIVQICGKARTQYRLRCQHGVLKPLL